jgi:superfamily II DNA/RNA helicase
MTFTELNLNENLLEAISHMGFKIASPIQELAIPIILEDKDLIACAQTGTGKTAAFVLPLLNKLIGKPDSLTDTLIIVPTRELAVQIDQEIQGLSYFISVTSAAIYGGGDGKEFGIQEKALKNGSEIIVATPGRLIAHLAMGYVDFSKVKHLVLDEADKMLDMGFLDDIEKIIKYLPKERQTLMFSATMPEKIKTLAKKILNNPEQITLSVSKPAAGIAQNLYLTHDAQKNAVLNHILKENHEDKSIIIFTSSKLKIQDIVSVLRRYGHRPLGFSSDLGQSDREEVLRGFRSKRTRILVATDVMSRGIDIKEVNIVINYDCPHDAEDYVHRIGRTARANTTGKAFTLVNERDMHKMQKIEKLIEAQVPRLTLPAELGEGPAWNPNAKIPGRNFAPKHSSNHKPHKPKTVHKKPPHVG